MLTSSVIGNFLEEWRCKLEITLQENLLKKGWNYSKEKKQSSTIKAPLLLHDQTEHQ